MTNLPLGVCLFTVERVLSRKWYLFFPNRSFVPLPAGHFGGLFSGLPNLRASFRDIVVTPLGGALLPSAHRLSPRCATRYPRRPAPSAATERSFESSTCAVVGLSKKRRALCPSVLVEKKPAASKREPRTASACRKIRARGVDRFLLFGTASPRRHGSM